MSSWIIPQEEGLYLASTRNPQREAQLWVSSLDLILKRDYVIVGLGLGAHVFEFWQRIFDLESEASIFVLEPRKNLIQPCFDLFPKLNKPNKIQVGSLDLAKTWAKERRIQVFEFRPSWGPRQNEFINYCHILNDRGSDQFKNFFHFSDLELSSDEAMIVQELYR